MLIRFPTTKGLVYTIDLSKIADRENPRTVEAPLFNLWRDDVYIDWGDGTTERLAARNDNYYPAHTYEGTENIYKIVIRNYNGNLPTITFCHSSDGWNVEEPTLNLTRAVVAVDHFAGIIGRGQLNGMGNHIARKCINMEYLDPRLPGLYIWTNYDSGFNSAILNQPAASFCLSFATSAQTTTSLFRLTKINGDLPEDFLSTMAVNSSVVNMFYGCTELTSPYIFWNTDGTIDNEKMPSLANGGGCYAGCSDALRAQVPTAYGGTMTVS